MITELSPNAILMSADLAEASCRECGLFSLWPQGHEF